MLRTRLTCGASVLILAVAASGFGGTGCARSAPVQMDLTPLAADAQSQNLGALIREVQGMPVGPEGFTFAVLGDTRSDIAAARGVLARAAAEKPAFVLHTGDVVRGGTVDEYLAHHLPLVKGIAPIPLIPVPGNHESGPNKDFGSFKALYGDIRFSFDYSDCRFVGVNNADDDGLSDADLAFLRDELGKPGAQHKFVVMHIPPQFLTRDANGEEGRGFKRNMEGLRRLMTGMKVDQVFVGHIHGYATEMLDGVRYTITGGGGAPLTKGLDPQGRVRNFVLVHVTPQGVKCEVFRLQGDQWTRSDIP